MRKRFITILEGKNKIVIEKLFPEYTVKYNGKKIGTYGTLQLAQMKAFKMMEKVI